MFYMYVRVYFITIRDFMEQNIIWLTFIAIGWNTMWDSWVFDCLVVRNSLDTVSSRGGLCWVRFYNIAYAEVVYSRHPNIQIVSRGTWWLRFVPQNVMVSGRLAHASDLSTFVYQISVLIYVLLNKTWNCNFCSEYVYLLTLGFGTFLLNFIFAEA